MQFLDHTIHVQIIGQYHFFAKRDKAYFTKPSMMINGYQGLNYTNLLTPDIRSGGTFSTPNLRNTAREKLYGMRSLILGEVENDGCLILELQDLQALKKGVIK